MANFDFGNTTITSDITLKAGWCCEEEEPTIPELWDGEWMKVTLTDGRVAYAPDKATAMSLVKHSNGASGYVAIQQNFVDEDGNNVYINRQQVKQIDFGTEYTTLDPYIFGFSVTNAFSGLEVVNGNFKNLTKLNTGYFMCAGLSNACVGYGSGYNKTVTGTFYFGPNITATEGGSTAFFDNCGAFVGTLYFDCPYVHPSGSGFGNAYGYLTCGSEYVPMYTQGIRICGSKADEWLEHLVDQDGAFKRRVKKCDE